MSLGKEASLLEIEGSALSLHSGLVTKSMKLSVHMIRRSNLCKRSVHKKMFLSKSLKPIKPTIASMLHMGSGVAQVKSEKLEGEKSDPMENSEQSYEGVAHMSLTTSP